ncbi:hypothetical protein FQA39_LY19396 [Lamprigera yunnana]|nr:hypothetical protein FQA39_LY19396 [Lamprigera yunnana]
MRGSPDDFLLSGPPSAWSRTKSCSTSSPGLLRLLQGPWNCVTDWKKELPEDWLKGARKRSFRRRKSSHRKPMGWDELMETLKKRLEDKKRTPRRRQQMDWHRRHQPVWHGGYNPAGIRIGGPGKNRSARQVWEQRAYRDYDEHAGAGHAQHQGGAAPPAQVCPRRPRAGAGFAGHHSRHGGQCGLSGYQDDPRAAQQCESALLMDVGGTMDDHIRGEEAVLGRQKASSSIWSFITSTTASMTTCGKTTSAAMQRSFPPGTSFANTTTDYKLIFVGDATMSPYEILQPGGSVEYNNEEPGAEWLKRLTNAFPKHAWINPEPQGVWQYRQSISLIQQLMGERMFPLSLKGLEDTMRLLSKLATTIKKRQLAQAYRALCAMVFDNPDRHHRSPAGRRLVVVGPKRFAAAQPATGAALHACGPATQLQQRPGQPAPGRQHWPAQLRQPVHPGRCGGRHGGLGFVQTAGPRTAPAQAAHRQAHPHAIGPRKRPSPPKPAGAIAAAAARAGCALCRGRNHLAATQIAPQRQQHRQRPETGRNQRRQPITITASGKAATSTAPTSTSCRSRRCKAFNGSYQAQATLGALAPMALDATLQAQLDQPASEQLPAMQADAKASISGTLSGPDASLRVQAQANPRITAPHCG